MSTLTRPPDPTVEAFLQALGRSKLIDPVRLRTLLAALDALVRRHARSLADALVADGHLTHYQANKLLLGLSQGLVLGPYHVLAPLGRGGMGTVYLGRDTREAPVAQAGPPTPLTPDQVALVALKVLSPKRAREDERTLLRFQREMELGRMLAHPNVTRTLDTGIIDGVHYIAMEFVPGDSLRRLVLREGPRPTAEAARIFADVAAGLAHAHGRGLIHRDLKPSNIMITPAGQAKILDLGMALLVDEALPADRSIVGGEGYILGTMDYISPEQSENATDVGPRSDLYSLGCSLYFTVTGVPPFPGGTSHQKIRWQRSEPPPPVRSLNPAVPVEFAALIEQLLAKKPDDRPGSAEEVQTRLLAWAGVKPAQVGNAPTAPPPSDFSTMETIDSPDFDPSLWELVAEKAEPPHTAAKAPVPVVPAGEDLPHRWEWPDGGWRWALIIVPPLLAILFVLIRGR